MIARAPALAALDVPCPRCGAPARQRCRSVAIQYRPGKLDRAHAERAAAARTAKPCGCTADVPCLAHVVAVSDATLATPAALAADLASTPSDVDMAGPDDSGPGEYCEQCNDHHKPGEWP